MNKLNLYWNTLRYLKPGQILRRAGRKLGVNSSLGKGLPGEFSREGLCCVQTVPELDFDPALIARFDADELVTGKVCFLNEPAAFDWRGLWSLPDRTPLWNFNLHYFEYLSALIDGWRKGREECLDCIRAAVGGWIDSNPEEKGGPGWESYTIALRLTNWISAYGALKDALGDDFCDRFVRSMHAQFSHLAGHLEKDVLGNHLFEDLKALVLGAVFFGDKKTLEKALVSFRAECREQILSDGMHYELSPMYHKIVFEGVLRVAVALRGAGTPDAELEKYIQPMLDAAYSVEAGLCRLPLFNDCGGNVAKSLSALEAAAENHFGLKPSFRADFPAAGYYIFRKGDLQVIADAGKPGPEYIPGHAHCDAMSFEAFFRGVPVIVNGGTYAYQCAERQYFRSTAAHNTCRVNDTEQSVCWGAFRMAARGRITGISADRNGMRVGFSDYRRQLSRRELTVDETRIAVTDRSEGAKIESFFHFPCAVKDAVVRNNSMTAKVGEYAIRAAWNSDSRAELRGERYAPDYGRMEECAVLTLTGQGENRIEIWIEGK